jgi:hypothetical protein
MQIPKTVVALTKLIPHPKTLMALAIKSRFVLRVPRKIWPDQILRAVLTAVCDGTPHFRAIAKNLAALSDEEPSRQAVFERLKHEAAPSFFAGVFRQVIGEQSRRFAACGGSRLERALGKARGVFGRVLIEDGSILPLHKSLADCLRGSSNQHGHCAALRLRWAFDFLSGETLDAELYQGHQNDMSTAFDLIDLLREGDMLLRDMGYFCLEGFREIARRGAWFLTRIPEGTVLCDPQGGEINLPGLLRRERSGLLERRVLVGRETPLEGRLVAARIEPEKAAQRRRALRKKLREEGKTPRRDQIEMCDWVVVFTNAGSDLIDGESVAQLYRARWMVEIFFKGMKSGQDLEKWSRHRTNENTIQCLAYAQMMIGVMSINLWRAMGRIVNLDEAGEAETSAPGAVQAEETKQLRMIGPIKAMESLIPMLRKVFGRELQGQSLGEELVSLARYATQEKRARVSLDFRILSLLT